ncbi:hypothetical protein ACTFIZ_002355 [Dictyostelium cf. discoideum]
MGKSIYYRILKYVRMFLAMKGLDEGFNGLCTASKDELVHLHILCKDYLCEKRYYLYYYDKRGEAFIIQKEEIQTLYNNAVKRGVNLFVDPMRSDLDQKLRDMGEIEQVIQGLVYNDFNVVRNNADQLIENEFPSNKKITSTKEITYPNSPVNKSQITPSQHKTTIQNTIYDDSDDSILNSENDIDEYESDHNDGNSGDDSIVNSENDLYDDQNQYSDNDDNNDHFESNTDEPSIKSINKRTNFKTTNTYIYQHMKMDESTFKKFTTHCIKLLSKKVKVDHNDPFYKSNFQLLEGYYLRNRMRKKRISKKQNTENQTPKKKFGNHFTPQEPSRTFETVIAASGDIQDENTINEIIDEQSKIDKQVKQSNIEKHLIVNEKNLESKCRIAFVAEEQLALNREMFNFNKSIMTQTLECKKKKLDFLEKLSNYLIQTTQSIDKELEDVEKSLN